MTGEELERAMDFVLEQQAKTEIGLQYLDEKLNRLADQAEKDQQMLRNSIEQAEVDRQAIREAFSEFRIDIDRLVDIVESDRETFSKSISLLSNSIVEDRKIFKQIARMAAASEKRIANLEARADKTGNSNVE